jgi:hypothetical protein
MDSQRTLRLMKERFAGREKAVESLFNNSETFRILCRDYLTCSAVLAWWGRSDSERTRRRASEFMGLLTGIRQDILRWLKQAETETIFPSHLMDPTRPSR